MSKEKIKTVANLVGATIGRPHFEGKAQKGITLIALVITIIVMLILVGVTISVSLNGGLFTTAKQAEDETQIAQEKEQLLMAVMGALGEDGKVNQEKLDSNLPEGFTGSNLQYTSKTGNVFKVSGNGSITLETDSNEDTGVTISPKKETYTVGEEVTIGNEHFFVIADDTEKVTLLAKYCLNLAGTAQLNGTNNETNYAFSSEPYWEADGMEGLDLNEYRVPDGVTSVITTAKEYGLTVTGNKTEGRLLRKDEANALKAECLGIICGNSYDAVDGFLNYWLGTVQGNATLGYKNIYNLLGAASGIIQMDQYSMNWGVRPVLEISKADL